MARNFFIRCMAILASVVFLGSGVSHATTIQTAPLDSVWFQPERSAAAQAIPRHESRLAAEVGGRIERWSVDVGAQVIRGAVLVEIDPTDLRLALERSRASEQAAQARLALARNQLQRAQELVKQGFYSQEALTQRETEVALYAADLQQARSQSQSAQRQLDKATLRAPFSGTVLQRTAQVGETVAPGSILYVMVDSSAVEIEAKLSPMDVSGLRRAHTVTFVPDSGAAPSPVQLARLAAPLQLPSRTQTARFMPSGNITWSPGTSGTVRWQDPNPHIPATLIVRRGEQLGVFIQEGAVARFIPLPQAQEGRAAVSPLPPETRIVVQGQATLTDGQALPTQH